MTIIIHRGADQIGGSIIEISTDSTSILLDAGCELDAPATAEPHEAITSRKYDAAFFSHNHLDHYGYARQLQNCTPLYLGADAYNILQAATRYKVAPLNFSCNTFRSGEKITVGDLTVTPFLVDHSAFDAHMLHVSDGNETTLYTGDFRSTGRKSFDAFLRRLPQVDTLICEGTTLGRGGARLDSEAELEKKAAEIMRTNSPVFILQASTNIDRLVTMYRAAKRTERLFLQELYMAEIATAAGSTIPNPRDFSDVRVFVHRPYDAGHFRYKMLLEYGQKKIGKNRIVTERFAMCIRSSMGNYLKSLSREMSFEGGALIYSMWSGYRRQPGTAEFLRICEELGLEIIDLHTSGHADSDAIAALIERVKPREIIPIHTENAAWFYENYPDLTKGTM